MSLASADPGVDAARYLASAGAVTAAFDLPLLTAWWFGSRWPIALGGAGSLVLVSTAAVAFDAHPSEAVLALVPQVVAVVAWFVGPELGIAEPLTDVGPARAGRAARAWIPLGALLWPLLVLFGTFPIVSDWCASCGPRFPGDELLAGAGVLTVPLVPLVALVAVGFAASDGHLARVLCAGLVVAAVLLSVEIAAGLLGVVRSRSATRGGAAEATVAPALEPEPG